MFWWNGPILSNVTFLKILTTWVFPHITHDLCCVLKVLSSLFLYFIRYHVFENLKTWIFAFLNLPPFDLVRFAIQVKRTKSSFLGSFECNIFKNQIPRLISSYFRKLKSHLTIKKLRNRICFKLTSPAVYWWYIPKSWKLFTNFYLRLFLSKISSSGTSCTFLVKCTCNF